METRPSVLLAACAALLAGSTLAGPSFAPPPLASPQEAPVVASHPVGAARCVASEVGAPDLVFAGVGGRIDVLVGDLPGPTSAYDGPYVQHTSGGQPVRLDLGASSSGVQGYAWDIALSATKVYAAAGRLGAARFDRASWTRDRIFEMDPVAFPDEQARTIAAITFAGREVVVVGTRYGTNLGRILMWDANQPAGSAPLWAYYAPAAVESVLLASGLYTDELMLYAGSACGAVYGFAFSYFACPSPVPPQRYCYQGWLLPLSPQVQVDLAATFVRDLALHVTGLGRRLYVAGYEKGVSAYQVSTASYALSSITDPGWPIGASGPGVRRYSVRLALDGASDRLGISLMTEYSKEEQFAGSCEFPTACIGAAGQIAATLVGVDVWSVPMTGAPSPQAQQMTILPDPDQDEILFSGSLAIRPADASNFFLDSAAGGAGARKILGKLFSPIWVTGHIATWDQANHNARVTNDTLFAQDGFLNCGTERGLKAYAATLPESELLDADPAFAYVAFNEGPIGITGFPNPNGRVLGVGDSAFYIFDTTNPAQPVLHLNAGGAIPKKDIDGDALLCRALQWPFDPVGTLSDRLLGVALQASRGVPGSPTPGAIKIWDVATALKADDPSVVLAAELPGDQAEYKAKYYDVDFGPVFLEGGTQTRYGYASSSRYIQTQPPPALPWEHGLTRFRLQVVTSGSRSDLLISQVTFVKAIATATNQIGWRVTYDGTDGQGFVYVSLGCGGLAVYQDANPAGAAPTLIGVRVVPGPACACGVDPLCDCDPMVVFEILRAWDDRLYVSTINDGLGILDDRDAPASAAMTMYKVRLQSIGLLVDPYDPTRHTLYMAGGNGGVDRIVFP